MKSLLTSRRLLRGTFWVWAAALFLVGSSLMVAHVVALPTPAAGDRDMGRAVNLLRSPSEAKGWMLVHVLYAQCRCSRRIVDHLATSERPRDVSEKVLLVGSQAELEPRLRELEGRGFALVRTTPVELRDRFHVEGAPLFVVVAPDGEVRYAGGYTERKQGLDVRDVAIVRELRSNGAATELPLFGCAVSAELKRFLDPLSLRSISDP